MSKRKQPEDRGEAAFQIVLNAFDAAVSNFPDDDYLEMLDHCIEHFKACKESKEQEMDPDGA